MSTTLTDPLLGRLVDGRYEVTSRIARGGMGTVYRGIDRRLDREVAVKVMHPHLAEGSQVASRFRREARAAARLSHPGVVAVYDQGSEGETSYLAMEYVPGQNLRKALRQAGAFTLGESLAIVAQVLDALAAAHRAGLVHRDIKPENVLISTDGRIKVADFGLARAVTEATAATTGSLLGTVAYLSPEIVTRGDADSRADVYAVGVLLYELITGSQPFTGDTPIQIAYQHVHETVPRASRQVRGLPEVVDELIALLTESDPDDRPADAAAAAVELRQARSEIDSDDLELRARVTGTEADETDSLAETTRSEDEQCGTVSLPIGAITAPAPRVEVNQPRRRRRRRRIAVVLVLLLVSAALGAGGWWYFTIGPGSYIPVPEVTGQDETVALEQVEAAELRPTTDAVHHDDVPAGTVIAVDPASGTELPQQSVVTLTVSLGTQMLTVPEVEGLPEAEALQRVEAAGFTVEPQVRTDYSADVEEGDVMAVSPASGERVAHHTPVSVTVSAGREPITVPNVVGASREQAVRDLENAGAVAADGEPAHSETVPEGRVMSQSVEGDALRGDTVEITLSLGPELFEVPSVVGLSFEDAEQELIDAGFGVSREDILGGYFNTVRIQSVDPGTMARRGTTITLTVV